MLKATVLIFILAVLFYKGEALKCYQCAATTACNDFNPSAVQTCTITSGRCLKSKVGDVETRGCTTSSQSTGCEGTDSFGGISIKNCVCDTDLCNGAPASLRSSAFLAAALAAGIFGIIFYRM